MRFTGRHTRNGQRYEKGDRFLGPRETARFLYTRGIIEADGSPGDDEITEAPLVLQSWDVDVDAEPNAKTPTAPSESETSTAWHSGDPEKE